MKTSFMLKGVIESLMKTITPKSLTLMNNLGSNLGILFVIQTLTGILLTFLYSSESLSSFLSVESIMRDLPTGSYIRLLHVFGVNLIFLLLYLHVFRNLYNLSFKTYLSWNSGMILFLLSMAAAFLGYVLPWGQMSFWGAMVITNFFSVIPVVGASLVMWMWGGFSVNMLTLKFFFSLHFLIPIVILIFSVFHLLMLHVTGSMLYDQMNTFMKSYFSIEFSVKDSITIVFLILLWLSVSCSDYLEADNWLMADSMFSPSHIQPEWYFLFIYAILRSIPNKLGGVLLMVLVFVLLFMLSVNSKLFSSMNSKIWKSIYWIFIGVFLLLTWLGAKPVVSPFIWISQFMTLTFFSILVTMISMNLMFQLMNKTN